MRILFTFVGGGTILLQMVPLAWACRTAGHEVRIASLPPAAPGAGLPVIEVGHRYDILGDMVEARGGPRVVEPPAKQWARSGLARPQPESENTVAERQADTRRNLRNQASVPWIRAASAMAPDLLRFADRWQPQLIIADPLVFAAPLVAARLGIPLLRYIWGPDMLRQIGYPLQGQPTGSEARTQWPTALVELYDRFGAAVRDDYAIGTVDPWPGSLQPSGLPGRIPLRFVPYNGAAAAPEWVVERSSRPRVCVCWGLSTSALGGDEAFMLPRVVEALAPLDIEVVLAVSAVDRDKLGEVPANCRVVENLPLHLLVPTCDAIVNQGGAGTVLTAACEGLPQVMLPQTADTPFNAANFSVSGAGITCDVAKATAESIADAVTTALTSQAMRAAAHKLRDEIAATPSPSEVVRTLEGLA